MPRVFLRTPHVTTGYFTYLRTDTDEGIDVDRGSTEVTRDVSSHHRTDSVLVYTRRHKEVEYKRGPQPNDIVGSIISEPPHHGGET